MGASIKLGKVFGIPIGVNYSWFIIFVLITFTLGYNYFPEAFPGWSSWLYWLIGVLTSLLFFASVLAHELAHSLVARANGIPVASITLFIFGGVAQIEAEATKAKDEFLMALAGPLSSVVISGICTAIWWLVAPFSEPIAALAEWLAIINLSLAVFNLIPGFPLDGGRVFRSVVWMVTGDMRKATRIASQVGVAIAYLFILGGVWIALTGNFIQGLWLAFIGWFLENAASSSVKQMALQDALKGVVARQVMSSDCSLLPAEMSVNELVENHFLRGASRCFLVGDGERMSGMVTLHNIKQISPDDWRTMSLAQIMTPVDKLITATPDEPVISVLQRMDRADVNQMPVMQDGQIVGMIARDNLLRFIALRSELKA